MNVQIKRARGDETDPKLEEETGNCRSLKGCSLVRGRAWTPRCEGGKEGPGFLGVNKGSRSLDSVREEGAGFQISPSLMEEGVGASESERGGVWISWSSNWGFAHSSPHTVISRPEQGRSQQYI